MDMILCKSCNTEKDQSDFYKGKNSSCKDCIKEKAKQSYHQKGGINNLRQWRENNPELFQEQRKRQKERRKQRRLEDPEYAEKIRLEKRISSRRNLIACMVGRARTRALKKGLDFDITKEDLKMPELCPILNEPLVIGTKGNYLMSPSLDRIEPDKGYVKGNVRIISNLANSMKNAATKQQLLTFAENIKSYLMI